MDDFTKNKEDLSISKSKKQLMFKPPKGTRDIPPDEMEKLQYMLSTISNIFERYGFRPLETPAFEDFKLLAAKGGGGQDIKEEIYYFKDKGKRELGLRFDLTIPLVRFLINNSKFPKPFKRYQIGRVWRYDNPQKLRYREFWQADIDTIGSESMLADVECIAAAIDCMKELGFENFYVRINNKKLLENLLTAKGIKKEKVINVYRIIDKLDKIGLGEVKKQLKKYNAEKVIDALRISGSNENILKNIEKVVGISAGITELRALLKFAEELGIEKYLQIDLSLVRGLEYYTGPIFEIMLKDTKVSVAGGGRYDDLIKTLGGPDLPATGISFGIDRLLSLLKKKVITTKFFIIATDDSLRKDALKICQDLRNKDINCDIDLMKRKMSKQMSYASSTKYHYVIIIGKKELKKKSVRLRDMISGKETLIRIDILEKELKNI